MSEPKALSEPEELAMEAVVVADIDADQLDSGGSMAELPRTFAFEREHPDDPAAQPI